MFLWIVLINVLMQSFSDILHVFWNENIFKVEHLKQVYHTKLNDDARKTSAIRGQNRNTRLHLTWGKSV